MSKGSAIVSILVAFVGGFMIGNVVGAGGGVGETEDISAEGAGAAAAALDDDVERFKVPVSDAQPAKGADDALVTIVQFSDFQCPFCDKVEPTIDQLMEDYEGKLRVVWRDNPLPFHKNAMPAAIAAQEAYEQGGDEMFWKLHELLFENQKQLERADIESYAKKAGLNMDKLREALDKNEHKKKIEKDQKLAQRLGARGTPAFFINGRFLSGAQPVARFKSIIDEEIKTAEKLAEDGVSKSKLYAAITKNGLTSKPEKKQAEKKRKVPDPNAVYDVPVGDSPQKGPDDALVTIVVFSEFQCPFCKRVLPTVEKVEEEYGKDIRIVFKHNPLPFHNNAMNASIAAMEAYEQGGDKKFWQMHDLLFENQRALDRENLEKYAKKIGLNMAQFRKALDNQEHKEDIEEDKKLGRSRGATGTPSFFINGRNLRGAQPFQAFKKVIDEELAKAKKKVAQGTAKSKLYASIIEGGATSPQFIETGGDDGDDNKGAKRDKPSKDKKYDIAVPEDAPRKGAKNPKVVIQEFSDFQCPFCSRVLPTVEKVAEEYGDRVQIVWRNFPLPFHKQAMPAAVASWEVYQQAGDKAFWKYHDLLFENQKSLSKDKLVELAKKVGGVDAGKVGKAVENLTHKDRIQKDMDAVREAGAQIGTPSFFVDGKLIQGAQPYPAFKSAIEEALKK